MNPLGSVSLFCIDKKNFNTLALIHPNKSIKNHRLNLLAFRHLIPTKHTNYHYDTNLIISSKVENFSKILLNQNHLCSTTKPPVEIFYIRSSRCATKKNDQSRPNRIGTIKHYSFRH